jgi:c-di-GMP-binding flagellar brake protein YcgR
MDNLEEDVERCTLTGSREIVFLIRELIRRRDRVSVIFQEGRQSFLTLLLDVSPNEGLFYFDIGGNDESNQAFLKADLCAFSTFIEGIRIQFSARGCRKVQWRGEPVFAAPLPQTLLRLQRREMFRLQLPGGKPFTCSVQRGASGDLLLPLRDISIGGVGVLSVSSLDHEQMEVLENCRLDLRENGTIHCALEIRHVQRAEARTGKPLWRMGCRFLILRPTDEMQIQRFMARMEAEQRMLVSS